MAAPSTQDLYDTAKAEIIARRPATSRSFVRGRIVDFIAGGIAAVADLVLYEGARLFRNTFLDGAKGQDLTDLVDDRYGLKRIDAVEATGSVTFTRAATILGGVIAAGTVVATQRDAQGTEVRFVTDAPLSVGVGENNKSVTVTAEVAGPAGNVAAAAVNRLITSGLFDTFTVSNAAAMAGGAEEEPDTDIRERGRGFNKTLRRATLTALEYGARQVPGIKRAVALEDATGLLTVYCTDADGNCSTALRAAVETELASWRAGGAALSVTAGILQTVAIGLTIGTRVGFNLTPWLATIQAAVDARVQRLGIGDTLYYNAIAQAVLNVNQDQITSVVVSVDGDAVSTFKAPTSSAHIIRAGVVTVG